MAHDVAEKLDVRPQGKDMAIMATAGETFDALVAQGKYLNW